MQFSDVLAVILWMVLRHKQQPIISVRPTAAHAIVYVAA